MLCQSAESDLCQGLEASDVMLVDFGRAVDLTTISDNTDDSARIEICGDVMRSDMRCVAMRADKPWSFDADGYGVLCSAHVLLFGTYMVISQDANKRWRPASKFRRYWQNQLWIEIFDKLLNLDNANDTTFGAWARRLRTLRERIESYLKTNVDKLRYSMIRQSNILPSSRDQLI